MTTTPPKRLNKPTRKKKVLKARPEEKAKDLVLSIIGRHGPNTTVQVYGHDEFTAEFIKYWLYRSGYRSMLFYGDPDPAGMQLMHKVVLAQNNTKNRAMNISTSPGLAANVYSDVVVAGKKGPTTRTFNGTPKEFFVLETF